MVESVMATQTARRMPLSAETWALVEKHFLAAVDLPAAEQSEYLQQHCSDAAIRPRVEELLASGEDVKTGLSTLMAREVQQFQRLDLPPGFQLGAYRLQQKIADGGMGAVYRASRADGAFEQDVAIKLLRQVLPSAEAVSRFRQERQVLARLQHVGIARLLDGGETEQGLPYLVMEYVQGQSVTAYCRDLPVADTLKLFQNICAAVQTAHQNLIVHRDIKASNILVNDQGQPKLLDFGIAKLLAEEGEDALTQTHFGAGPMTPETASPEQISGAPITTASDVYSLGVLLYQLLARVAPYAAWRTEPLALQRAICETDPRPPSRLGEHSGKAKHARLPEELDHIVLKAMRKDPAQRYQSPAALADDIQRFLDGLPVLAKRGKLRYRTGKFLRRHRWAVSAAAVAASPIIALVSFYTWQLAKQRDVAQQQTIAAQTQQQIAERERESAQRLSDFMVELFKHADPRKEDSNVTVAELLDTGIERVQSELADQPLLAARLFSTFAAAQYSLGNWKESEALYRRSLASARAVALPNDFPLADTLKSLGELLYNLERWEESELVLQQALQTAQQQWGATHPEVGRILMRLVQMHLRQHRLDGFIFQMLERARLIFTSATVPNIDDLVDVHQGLAAWSKLNYDYAEALRYQMLARGYTRKAHAEDSRGMMYIDENLGRIQWRLGDCVSAIKSYDKAEALFVKFLGPSLNGNLWATYFRSLCEHVVGDYVSAVESFQRLIPLEENNTAFGGGRYLSRALARYAAVLADLGQYPPALSYARRAEQVLNEGVGTDSVEHFHVQYAYARIEQWQSHWPQAIAHWQNYVALRRRELASEAPQLALGELRLADTYINAGQLQQAQGLVDSALPRLQAIHGEQHPEYAIGLAIRARLKAALGQTQDALQDYQQAISSLPEAQRNDREVLMILQRYAQLLQAQGRAADAQRMLSRVASVQARIQVADKALQEAEADV